VLQKLEHYLAGHYMAEATRLKLRHRVNCWRRFSRSAVPNPAEFDGFRRRARSEGLTAQTVEATVGDIARICGQSDLGTRLPRWRNVNCRAVPSLDLISAVYEAAPSAEWPNCVLSRTPALRVVSSAVWLRAFVVFAYYTAFRLRDLRSVTWSGITTAEINWQSSKTGRLHRLPNCPVVERHLEPLRECGSTRLFPISSGQERLLRRELSRLTGDTRAFGPQPLRRAAITQWSIASPEAGRIVHGSGLGMMAHYLDPFETLVNAMPRRRWPAAMLTPAELDERHSREHSLAELAQRLPLDRLDDLLKVGRAFAG
jgi:hypothetical protein